MSITITTLSGVIAAAGALGTASFGIVEGLKWTALGTAGFGCIGEFNARQQAAARFANSMLAGVTPLVYG